MSSASLSACRNDEIGSKRYVSIYCGRIAVYLYEEIPESECLYIEM